MVAFLLLLNNLKAIFLKVILKDEFEIKMFWDQSLGFKLYL